MIGYASYVKPPPPAAVNAAWQCPKCGLMNPHEVGRCSRCAAKKGL